MKVSGFTGGAQLHVLDEGSFVAATRDAGYLNKGGKALKKVGIGRAGALCRRADRRGLMALLLGCIADDFTGATDLANTLVRNGMRTIQVIGVPDGLEVPAEAEAIVVALKSRTAPVAEAVAQSLASCRWLRQAGARQIYFKYCSTFDSTDEGNIGPVADALRAELGADFATVCPAFPETGRTIYNGHLFVGDVLLSDSSMRNHPLTPMTDANLVRVLGRQTKARGRSRALCDGAAGNSGDPRGVRQAAAPRRRLCRGRCDRGRGSALPRRGLRRSRAGDRRLGRRHRLAGQLPPCRLAGDAARGGRSAECRRRGRRALRFLLGATLAQVARMRTKHPSLMLDPLTLAERGEAAIADAMAWADRQR